MIRRYDVLHAVILVLFIGVADFIENAVIKGILLLLFSVILTISTVIKLKMRKNDLYSEKLFYRILLFLDIVLMAAASLVIITAVF